MQVSARDFDRVMCGLNLLDQERDLWEVRELKLDRLELGLMWRWICRGV